MPIGRIGRRKRPVLRTFLLLFFFCGSIFGNAFADEPEKTSPKLAPQLAPNSAPKLAPKLATISGAVYDAPVFEIYPPEALLHHRDTPFAKNGGRHARVSIIIDDIGYDVDIVDKFLALDVVLTFSLFPESPFRDRILPKIRAKGLEIMLHLPMEPMEYPDVNPGKGALLATMTPDEIIRQLSRNIDSLPGIIGVNNHMGSRLTAMPAHIYRVLSELKRRDLFFVDSVTSGRTICRTTARTLQLPFARRDVFIDHLQTKASIRNQLRKLVNIAKAYGEAVGIAHPYPATFEVLQEELPVLEKEIRLVPASAVVHTSG